MFESWIMDARYAGRRLLSRPTYAALAVLTLALAAGGTAAIISVVRTLLLDRLPVANEEQVGVLWFGGSWTEQEFLRLRLQFPGFERMAAYRPNDMTLEMPGSPMRLVLGLAVSAEFFDVLGTLPECRTEARDERVQSLFEFAVNRGDSRRPLSTPRKIPKAREDG